MKRKKLLLGALSVCTLIIGSAFFLLLHNGTSPAHAASNQQQCTTSKDNKVKACISRTSTGGIVTSYHIDCDGTTSKDGGAAVINEVKNGNVDPAHGNNGGSGGTEVKCGDGNGPTYTTSVPGTSYSSTVTAWFDNGGFDSIDSPQV
jgi:hypothetical protein